MLVEIDFVGQSIEIVDTINFCTWARACASKSRVPFRTHPLKTDVVVGEHSKNSLRSETTVVFKDGNYKNIRP